MEKMSHPDVPDEKQIESMLSEIRPRPSPRFESMMQDAPWLKPASTARSNASTMRTPARKYVWLMAAGIFVVFLLSIMFIPSVRAIARQIIFSFIFAPSNQLEVQVTLSSPADLFNYTDPINFPLSIEAAKQEAGFNVKQLTNLPASLTLRGARFDPKYYSVSLLYEGLNYQLLLTQRPLGNGADVFSIGSDADVKLVTVGEVRGEFVAGGWRAISTQPATPDSVHNSTVNISAVWDDNLPQATLRWQQEGYVYELRSLGEGGLSQNELIKLANGLQ